MSSDSSSCTEKIQNPPKRKKTLRKRKSDAGPSTSYFNSEDYVFLSSNEDDFQSSGENDDITWHANPSDYEKDDDEYSEYSFSPIIDQKISIVANNVRTTSGSRPEVPEPITLCSVNTANSAVEANTVSNIIINNDVDGTVANNNCSNITAKNFTAAYVGPSQVESQSITTVRETNQTTSM